MGSVAMTTDDAKVKQEIVHMMKGTKAPTVIKHAGQVNEAEVDGITIKRYPLIFIPTIGTVKAAPTDNHFVFRDARRLGWTLFCTCGSPSVVISDPEVLGALGSSDRQLLVCFYQAAHMDHRHADGSH